MRRAVPDFLHHVKTKSSPGILTVAQDIKTLISRNGEQLPVWSIPRLLMAISSNRKVEALQPCMWLRTACLTRFMEMTGELSDNELAFTLLAISRGKKTSAGVRRAANTELRRRLQENMFSDLRDLGLVFEAFGNFGSSEFDARIFRLLKRRFFFLALDGWPGSERDFISALLTLVKGGLERNEVNSLTRVVEDSLIFRIIEFSHQGLASLCWSFVQLLEHPGAARLSLWDALSMTILGSKGSPPHGILANMAWSWAKVCSTSDVQIDSELVDWFATQTRANIEKLQTQDLSNLLQAFSVFDRKEVVPFIYGELSRRNLKAFETRQLLSLCLSLATLDVRAEEYVFERISKEVLARKNDFSLRSLANFCYAIRKADGFDQEMFEAVFPIAMKFFTAGERTISAKDLSNLFFAFDWAPEEEGPLRSRFLELLISGLRGLDLRDPGAVDPADLNQIVAALLENRACHLVMDEGGDLLQRLNICIESAVPRSIPRHLVTFASFRRDLGIVPGTIEKEVEALAKRLLNVLQEEILPPCDDLRVVRDVERYRNRLREMGIFHLHRFTNSFLKNLGVTVLADLGWVQQAKVMIGEIEGRSRSTQRGVKCVLLTDLQNSAISPVNPVIVSNCEYDELKERKLVTVGLGEKARSRETHAEAVALSQVLERTSGKPNQMGSVCIHISRRPCLSCLGCIRQFQALRPNIRLTVTYDH